MLAICDNIDMHTQCHDLREDKAKLTAFLSKWMEDCLGMTATLNSDNVGEIKESQINHPSTVLYSEISGNDKLLDGTHCQVEFQNHVCSGYCMRDWC